MLPLRQISKRSSRIGTPYICLSCRLQSSVHYPLQLRDIDDDNVVGLPGFEQHGRSIEAAMGRRRKNDVEGGEGPLKWKMRRRHFRVLLGTPISSSERRRLGAERHASSMGLQDRHGATTPGSEERWARKAEHFRHLARRQKLAGKRREGDLFRRHNVAQKEPLFRTFATTAKWELEERECFDLVTSTAGLKIAKQLGTSPRSKEAAAWDEKRREQALDVLDVHREAGESGKVDFWKLDQARRSGESRRIYRPRVGVDEEELGEVWGRYGGLGVEELPTPSRVAGRDRMAETASARYGVETSGEGAVYAPFEQEPPTKTVGEDSKYIDADEKPPKQLSSASHTPTELHDSRQKPVTRQGKSKYAATREKSRKSARLYHSNGPTTRPATTSSTQIKGASNFPCPSSPAQQQLRLLHTSRTTSQQAATAADPEPPNIPPPPPPSSDQSNLTFTQGSIRSHLRTWQTLHANPTEDNAPPVDFNPDPDLGEGHTANTFTRLPDIDTALSREANGDKEADEALAHFSKENWDGDNSEPGRFLLVGDLVELEFPFSERESIIAVVARRAGNDVHCFTINGRWTHIQERLIQYSIPGWVDPKLVQPLLEHIPHPKTIEEVEKLRDLAYMEDLSIPRHVSAPLVSRLVAFHTESQEIYRKHASTLDSAHDILAHETDLRYGSLVSAATTLLQTPADKLPVTALFTVRSALQRAGFAFNVDKRSHRLTGYLQIRSKEQVRMVEFVRTWIREWQDDLAAREALQAEGNERALRKHRTTMGAQYVYTFLEKAKRIVLKSRENRDATVCGNIGPSKKKFPITPMSDSVRTTTDQQFTEQDTEIVRFIEAFSCSSMFLSLARLQALPPLLLQATGLYPDYRLTIGTAFLFLQELGVLMPWENRIRFDPHLLLPSSQHSKPLQNLMSSLMEMQNSHNFSDSMRHLRHDWKDMPVYCIDSASAHEIDDGLSVERAGDGHWWVHVHIANPTAFFERDHALAKMARHMGESIYMPERAYMMLPRWATLRHFSLERNRPCLTVSALLDSEGKTVERRIRSGILRKALRLTPDEVETVLDAHHDGRGRAPPEKVITVGGEAPASRPRRSMLPEVKGEMVEELKTLSRLAGKRSEIRRSKGGVFFDMPGNDIEVWQSAKSTGLAWDHPHRKGARSVEGDPVIQMRSRGLQNWFKTHEGAVDIMVKEMMLLACETAAAWCAERGIPSIYRGTVPVPGMPDPDTYYRDIMLPAAQKSKDGEVPMHLSIQYLRSMGKTVLKTSPIKHKLVGLEPYAKVTSPLRRYGDMIAHWQIEAALREEARTGKSLLIQPGEEKKRKRDLSFLPFSSKVLETIMVGLQPREHLIHRVKAYATKFWIALLVFRAHHFGETSLPFAASQAEAAATGKPLMRVFCHTDKVRRGVNIPCIETTLNLDANMWRPEVNYGLEAFRHGDTWEAEVDWVDVYKRIVIVKPVRLVERAEV